MPYTRLIILILQLVVCLLAGSDSGGHKEFDVLSYLGSKAPYPTPDTKAEQANFLEECRPIYINHLGRHGSRYLGKTTDIDELIEIISQAEQAQHLQGPGRTLPLLLSDAHNIESPGSLGQLTEQGRQEQRAIAERMYENFPRLFANSEPRKPIILQSTRVQRTKDSLSAFWGRLVELQPMLADRAEVVTGADHCDPLLRFAEGCEALDKYQDEHPWKSPIKKAVWNQNNIYNIHRMLERIFTQALLGQLDDHKQIDIVRELFHLCQLDANVGQANAKDRFCSFFANTDEIEPFGWEEDAKAYFKKGFAGQNGAISHQVACVLLNDFIVTTKKAIDMPKSAPVANLRFAHAETIMPFLVLLGLFRDDSVETMLQNPEERVFRTAVVSPMSANIQWILYQCPDDEFRVRMLHNERDVAFPIPGCDETSCNWEIIKSYYQSEGRTCDQNTWKDEICQGVSCTMASE